MYVEYIFTPLDIAFNNFLTVQTAGDASILENGIEVMENSVISTQKNVIA